MFSIGGLSAHKPNPKKIAEIKRWVRRTLNLDDKTTVFVTQLECHEPGCPPVETVIALLRSGQQSQQRKMHKSVNDLNYDDINRLFAGECATNS